MALEDELLSLEHRFWTGGPDVYRDHADAECLVVFTGMVETMSREAIAASAEAGRWRDVRLAKRGLMRLADDAVVITYECRAVREDGRNEHAFVSSGYVRRPDGWKLAFHQQTPAA